LKASERPAARPSAVSTRRRVHMFTAEDVVKFAVRIEANGEIFYREAERQAKDEAAKALFKHLADEEVEHKKLFQKMLAELTASGGPREGFSDEWISYFQHHIDGRAVFKGKVASDTPTAIERALEGELDAVAYFRELKNFLPEQAHAVLDALIAEEKSHFTQLAEYIKRLP
jgi:rubrerythrin